MRRREGWCRGRGTYVGREVKHVSDEKVCLVELEKVQDTNESFLRGTDQAGRDSGILRREKTSSKEEERRRKQAKRTWMRR